MERPVCSHEPALRHRRRFFLAATFSSLRHSNYRMFFFGQMISLIGTWMQMTAQGWLVYELTGSKVMLGVVGMVGTLPLALLSPLGGFAADRFPRRSVLLVTQSCAMVMPLVLSALVLTGAVRVWHVALLAGFLGVVNAFDMPTRQSFAIEMVGREDLMNAIGLNSGIFNTARIVGPALAGITMASIGIGYCFMLNGLSYIAVVAALAMMDVPGTGTRERSGSFLRQIAGGFSYVKKDARLSGLLGLLAVVSVFGFSYTSLLPAFGRDVFRVGPRDYSLLLTFNGIGALTGALVVATFGNRRRGKRQVLLAGIALFCVAISAFSLTRALAAGLTSLLLAGAGMIMFMTTANTLIQSTVPDEYRGRVMGIWTFVFGGAMPVGAICAGTVAHYIGVSLTVRLGAAVSIMMAAAAAITARRLKPLPAPGYVPGPESPY